MHRFYSKNSAFAKLTPAERYDQYIQQCPRFNMESEISIISS